MRGALLLSTCFVHCCFITPHAGHRIKMKRFEKHYDHQASRCNIVIEIGDFHFAKRVSWRAWQKGNHIGFSISIAWKSFVWFCTIWLMHPRSCFLFFWFWFSLEVQLFNKTFRPDWTAHCDVSFSVFFRFFFGWWRCELTVVIAEPVLLGRCEWTCFTKGCLDTGEFQRFWQSCWPIQNR